MGLLLGRSAVKPRRESQHDVSELSSSSSEENGSKEYLAFFKHVIALLFLNNTVIVGEIDEIH